MNPFAKNAGAERNRLRDEKAARDRRRDPSPVSRTPNNKATGSNENPLAKRMAEAKKNLSPAQNTPAPSTTKPVTNVQNAPKQQESKESRENRLEELRRKSQANQANAKSIVKKEEPIVKPEVKPKIETVEAKTMVTVSKQTINEEKPSTAISSPVKNVFKQIQTVKKKQDHSSRRRRKQDKKGGGRQKQVKKLNRQKYLEYKYEAKDILSHEGVQEEHRSNVLGQVWAKGERIGVQESINFIDLKELELIIPEEVAEQLRSLINRITTRR